jgi:hypothetical protein
MVIRILKFTAAVAILMTPIAAQAQGIGRGAAQGAAVGNHAAGPVGAVVGGAAGGVAGGVVGGVKGVLGVPQRTGYGYHHYRRHHPYYRQVHK